jgi:hypothetical protein
MFGWKSRFRTPPRVKSGLGLNVFNLGASTLADQAFPVFPNIGNCPFLSGLPFSSLSIFSQKKKIKKKWIQSFNSGFQQQFIPPKSSQS